MSDEARARTTPESDEPHVDRSVLIGLGGRWLTDWALRLAILLIACWLVAKIGGALWVGILPILLALIVSTVLWPPTGWMTRHGVPKALAALTSILGSLAVIAGVLALIAPSIVDQTVKLTDQTSEAITAVQDWLRGPPLNIRDEQLDGVLSKLTSTLQDSGDRIANGVFTGVSAIGSIVVTLVLVLVLTFFFIKDGPKFLPFVRRNVGRTAGRHLTEVFARSWNTLGGFIRTQALVSMVDAIFIGAGLVLLDVPLAWALAIITFLAGFIPIVGAVSAGALAVLIALVANGLTTAIIVLVLILLVQQLESNVLAPVLQSRAMNLHPVVVLLGVAAGSTLFGIIGAFLAVPVLAVVAVLLRYTNEQIDLRTGDVTASDLASATDEGRLTAWLGELSSSRFAPLRKSSSAIMAGVIDARPDLAAPGTAAPSVTEREVAEVLRNDDEVGAALQPATTEVADSAQPATQGTPPTGPVDPRAVQGARPSPTEEAESKPNPLRRFGRFLARRLEG
ncbi:AI-2E family transporter [Dietzia alimentaria]|uniref:AI-2E family transporter n=1 Tax=Dietzia alimentaria TaxID=665550 RepID=UPI00029A4400|nr:AI-2E family transporter [Dietzia alimentaria]